MEKKIKNISTKLCEMLELLVAVLVLIGVVIAIITLIPNVGELWQARADHEAFLDFLENVFIVVIGIEFLKMLCRPNSDNILETIIFLVARHMIISTTTPLEDLISTISIVILCFVRRYLKMTRDKDKRMAVEEEIRLEELQKEEADIRSRNTEQL